MDDGGGRCCPVSKHGFQSRVVGGGGDLAGGGIELSQMMRTVAITVDPPPHPSESEKSDDSENSDCSSSETALIFGDKGRGGSQIDKNGSNGKKVSPPPVTGIQQTVSSPTLPRGVQYGTYGYSDPQYMYVRQQEDHVDKGGGRGCLAALSADVFSFGVILLQVLDRSIAPCDRYVFFFFDIVGKPTTSF
jgi:hypothetical protein